LKLEDIKKMFILTSSYSDSKITNEVAVTSDEQLVKNNRNVLIDVKGIFNRKEAEDMNYLYWRL
jgi:UDP-N-acetyl-D-galactosamine dehydrogenase